MWFSGQFHLSGKRVNQDLSNAHAGWPRANEYEESQAIRELKLLSTF